MAIRVLRILEYVYQNEEDAAEDMARWTLGFSTVKAKPSGGQMVMKSATMPFESVPWKDPVY